MSEWHITEALFGLWVLLRLRRAWFWFGLGSATRIKQTAHDDPGFGERLLWWRRHD